LKKFNHIDYEYPTLERITNPDGSRVYKTPTGRSYPSVTTVTGLLKKKQILEWRKSVGEEAANEISRKAANRGTRIHSLCEKHLLNETVEPSMFDTPMWESIKGKLDSINNIYALEQQLYSDHLQVAGTVDCIAEYGGKLSVIDFKTSRRIKHRDDIHDYFIQCSAYAVAFEEMTKIPVSRLVIILAVEDEDTIVFQEKRDEWIGQFVDLREEYRKWKNI
jgi:ATP-dependent exoDNAse (exonuclease V) beta subunit